MNTVVVYRSKTGFAKKYAKWLSEELTSDLFDVKDVNIEQLKKYDTIIYGAGLYAVGINGINFIKSNLDSLKDKRIIVYATGVSPVKTGTIEEVRNNNFTDEEQKYINFFYLRGGFDFRKLNLKDKFLMSLLKQKIKKKAELTPDDKGMLAAYNVPVDFSRKEHTHEILDFISKDGQIQ